MSNIKKISLQLAPPLLLLPLLLFFLFLRQFLVVVLIQTYSLIANLIFINRPVIFYVRYARLNWNQVVADLIEWGKLKDTTVDLVLL